MPYINIEEREMGYSNDGEKVTMLGRIYGFGQFNGICVLKVEKDSQYNLVFMELNNTKNNVDQIVNENDIAALKELWNTTKIIDSVAEKLGLNKYPN